ncbi:MAG: phosphoribosylamine--glycine ligase [Candidatus Thiodiazotropha sp. (ex Dulcina madagascariensis)]|nr:phosphoribosylamine--glycine ligase [Candidatus Thiodiazotropha sp. (ex Dulcina madagascariensis)]
MNILVIGSGGREHALAWKAAQSPLADKVYVAPGNAGTALEDKLENVTIGVESIDELIAFAKAHQIGLTIVGPEAPLVIGIVDVFSAAGLRCFGPTRGAAQLEGSKSFTKDFLARHRIPTGDYRTFSDLQPALDYLHQAGAPIVIKADGLAAGKGVIVAMDLPTAESAVRDMLAGNAFGEAGHRVVIEAFLEGEEASFIVMADGEHVLPMATSQDHKRIGDGDTGLNTGGMGAYSPAPVVTEAVYQRIMQEVILPTVRGMAEEGTPYTGFLYAGLMIAPDGAPKVIEYNCRFGDPETQPIMLRMRSDLVAHCLAALEGRLDRESTAWDPRASVGVVLAAGGYPGRYDKGKPISGLAAPETPSSKVFHAGTALENDQVVTAGGRVLCATALGETVTQAQRGAYDLVRSIHWEGVCFRKDIGYRAIAREQAGKTTSAVLPGPLLFRALLALALLLFSYLAFTPSEIYLDSSLNDKISHALTFLCLAVLVDFSWPGSRWNRAKILWLMSYGLFIEAVQGFLPYRMFSLLDLAADAVGLLCYPLLLSLLMRIPGLAAHRNSAIN